MGAEVSVYFILYPRLLMMAPLDQFVSSTSSHLLSALTNAAGAFA
jgi:hypothetical protein